jgi:hypothetical protein
VALQKVSWVLQLAAAARPRSWLVLPRARAARLR